MVGLKCSLLACSALLLQSVSAQTFRRTAGCPTLGCVFPVDQTDFIAGQVFDIRLEIQAPANGSVVYNGGVPNPNYNAEISIRGGPFINLINQFGYRGKPTVENYNFTYFEDLFAEEAKTPTLVNVIAVNLRAVAFYNPGNYVIRLTYNGGAVSTARYTVKPLTQRNAPKAKNLVLLVGDGMSSSMVTAARLLSHKSINGKYQSRMHMDTAPNFGMQMTHSMDSFITDSANSATALYTGKKATVNGLNMYTDSTGEPYNGPKFESIFEMGRRIYHAQIGIVSTAFLADATPAAVCAHTSQRSRYARVVDQYLNGVANFTWTKWDGPDVLFGGGGKDFVPSSNNKNVSQVAKFVAAGYKFAADATALSALDNSQRALGLFHTSTMSTWLDRNVYTSNLAKEKNFNGTAGAALNQPGLKAMTIKAIDILSTRAKAANVPWMMMAEAASIDKQMHSLDYDRALGELMELDDTLGAVLQHLRDIGEYDNTLVIVTADHAHGFDVFGSSDSKFIKSQSTNATRRGAVGTYQSSGLSEYMVAPGSLPNDPTMVTGPQGPGFPVQWDPRYTIAAGVVANPDHHEDFIVSPAPRVPSIETADGVSYFGNPTDAADGFFVSGNLPGLTSSGSSSSSGVHSLADVPVYAWGPGASAFNGMQDSTDIAFKIALAMDLGRLSNVTYYK